MILSRCGRGISALRFQRNIESIIKKRGLKWGRLRSIHSKKEKKKKKKREEEAMKGSLFHELEVGLPAGEVWEVYGTLRLAQLVVELLPNVVQKFDLIEGDGGVGTVLHITFPPGMPGPQFYKEKFVKIDNEKYVKDAMVIEGGYLDLGFHSYSVRFEIIEKDINTSIIKSTIEYEIDEEHEANASFVTTVPLAAIAETISKYLVGKKTSVTNS